MISNFIRSVVLAGAFAAASPLGAQISQSSIARDIGSADLKVKTVAIQNALAIAPSNRGPALRDAMIASLETEGSRLRAAKRADRVGGAREPHPEEADAAMYGLIEAVSQLKDSRAIPALCGVLGTGLGSVYALAEFGVEAVNCLVIRVRDAEVDEYTAVSEGLIALRFIVESETKSLPAAVRSQIRDIAAFRLVTRAEPFGSGSSIKRAIDLAVVLGDPALRVVVDSLAYRPEASIRRGIGLQYVDGVQKRAQDALRGVPPLPRPPRTRP